MIFSKENKKRDKMNLWLMTYLGMSLISFGLILGQWGKERTYNKYGWSDLIAWIIGMIFILGIAGII
jgi:amino acid transporter